MSARKLLSATAAFATAAGVGVAAWTQIERRMPTLRRYAVELPEGLETPALRILQIADPHLYPGQDFLVDFIRGLADEDFDFVVATGDNFGSIAGADMVRRAFEPLTDRPGAFVFGSNDYYSPRKKRWSTYLTGPSKHSKKRNVPDLPWEDLASFFEAAGWVNLTNQAEIIDVPVKTPIFEGDANRTDLARIGLIGVDDPHIKRDHIPELPDGWYAADTIRLGITHAPYQRVLNEYTSDEAHLILAGHTHGGQLCVPGYGALVTNCDLPRELASGLATWSFAGKESPLHVSAGLGTSPYAPVRFMCRPEASIIEMRPAARA